MKGSARNFLRTIVQVSATTFIFKVSMNFASSPQIQAMSTVSDTEKYLVSDAEISNLLTQCDSNPLPLQNE